MPPAPCVAAPDSQETGVIRANAFRAQYIFAAWTMHVAGGGEAAVLLLPRWSRGGGGGGGGGAARL